MLRLVMSGEAMAELLRSPSGAVARWLIERGEVVKIAAQRQVGKDTHTLEHSIVKRFAVEEAMPTVMIGVPSGSPASEYALLHHEGTRPHDIFAKQPGGVLAFRPRGSDDVVFVGPRGGQDRGWVHHPGTKPNRYLTDNLPLILASSPTSP